jgi:hypothetical protein
MDGILDFLGVFGAKETTMKKLARWATVAFAVAVPAGSVAGCGGDSSGTPDVAEDTGDTFADVPVDTTGDTPTDTDPGPWNATITIEVDGRSIPVNLAAIARTTFEGNEAVRITRVVEVAALAMPWNYHYDFIGNDGYDPLTERLGGDLGKLPCYGEMESGFLYWDVDTLRIGWDPALGFPGALGVQGMDGGIIRATPIATNTVVIDVGDGRTLVDLTTLPTVDVIDYQLPADGVMPSIPFPDLIAAAGGTTPEAFNYKFWGNDGWSNNDDLLMPWVNGQHAYIRVDTRRIVLEEAWDTDGCCWRCRDTILIKGIAP